MLECCDERMDVPHPCSSLLTAGRWRLLAAALTVAVPGAGAQALTDCVGEADGARRLACYDLLFRDSGAALPAPAPAPPAAAVVEPPPAAAPAASRWLDDRPEALLVSTLFNTAWELRPSDKRGTFIVRTHLPNFVLPAHFTSSINRSPSSPTQPPSLQGNHYRSTEAKIQVSLRAKIAEGLVLPDADLWFAFTQRSMWQLYDRQDSSPFRSTDYQPEAIYVIPVSPRLGTLPFGLNLRMIQLGLAHQSNGQNDPLSRSWNRAYAAVAFDREEFGLTIRANHRLKESRNDDNPDLTRYIGNTELVASWLPGLSTAQLTLRAHPGSGKGSAQLDWSYPVQRSQPSGLRWYVQLFSGYGETLLDYNHKQTSLGIGLTLFQF